ncbi:MAG: TetR family transcriptional regulator [Reyranella sp.]|nr:TetR family transcriptional regulator [Reyranella sp.]
MPVSLARKARTRAEILEHAARLFRLRGNAGTNIDDIMLAAGLTRGAFYSHFTSKDDLFAETIRAGHGLSARLRAGAVETVLDEYLDKDALAANALSCALAALPADVARGPLAAQLAYANQLHITIGELARGRRRKLDADATAAAILAIGAVVLARASGDRTLADWLLRCARRTTKALLKPPVLRARPKSRSRRKSAAARRPKRAARSRGGRAEVSPKVRSSGSRR